ncbi:hypothetical protein FAZ95_01635 [Trinickia violacea]|uniref:Uncharacterized protein n=1 Tax=Trinickia violacea TaxID=2571746 RepID=A0A4P8IIL7_9BURK|nr:hypothetical protein [Trinickia violacea]QCP47996.1 hypothetical protein FAZ95_01635 [Trinickia violacea]
MAIGYFVVVFLIFLGGAGAIVLAEVVRAREYRFFALGAYLASVILPLLFGVLRQFAKLGAFRANRERDWMVSLSRCVDFDRYIITPGKYNESGGRDMGAVIFSTGAMVTNIPILFQIYTGSRDNVIFVALPVFVGVLSYLNVKVIGPQIASLLLLRKYEKQTGRHFVNADYEKIQDLRRTFFLSRWLMKDYRPATDTPQAG